MLSLLGSTISPGHGSYTPRHLAEKILTSGSALAGERKQVTVLFVDVSGFTSLSARLDPGARDRGSDRPAAQTWLGLLALGRLQAARGRREEALARYRGARAVIAHLRMRTRDPDLRAGLESTPLIREVEELARARGEA
jgi:hypothetical protein